MLGKDGSSVSFVTLQHSERNFVIKISALEIYNEVVKDLLNADNNSGPLRLMDDPEVLLRYLCEKILLVSFHARK
jgi:centromeric protein E